MEPSPVGTKEKLSRRFFDLADNVLKIVEFLSLRTEGCDFSRIVTARNDARLQPLGDRALPSFPPFTDHAALFKFLRIRIITFPIVETEHPYLWLSRINSAPRHILLLCTYHLN